MAKGGNNQRSNGSRFAKPYDASNSFVKKVALRVSGYLGGLFGSSAKTDDSMSAYNAPFRGTEDGTLTHSLYEMADAGKSIGLTRCYDDLGVNDSPAKRLKIGTKRNFVPDLPISPIASSSSLFQSSVPHNFDIQNSEDFITSVAGPSGLQNQKYAQTNSIATTTSANTNIKANGATDNHSDSSESTSGCSSLVPQSDRLSQSAFVSNSRKKILEEKLQYARQMKQTRASMYLNRSIPVVSDTTGSRRKPSFDVSVYGSPIFDKSSVREKMVNSPFYTGQTSYGGASAYRRPRTGLYSQQSGRPTFERKDGLQIHVKPSHHGSTEDLSNMSHTAKRILEALEQFSTPISDAKRIPVNPGSPPLGRKRKRTCDSLESTTPLSMTKTPLNQSKGPLISGLSIPTVPDLLKLKRLEKIQDSTAAARQVAAQKEYSLPSDVAASKHTGKIVTKRKDKEKEVTFERPPEVNLPKIPLPISTLPKFDFKLAPLTTPATADGTTSSKPVKATIVDVAPSKKVLEPNKTFKFSLPISLSVPENIKNSSQKSNFTFSTPLNADYRKEKSENAVLSNLSNFMSPEAMLKLKRKSLSDKPNSTFGIEPAKELKSGGVMDLLRKTLESNKKAENESAVEGPKSTNDTWECTNCLLRNLKDSKNCTGCKASKLNVPSGIKTSTATSPSVSASNTDSKSVNFTSGFGNKFKPPSDSWSCKECFVNNNSTAIKCIACENPKPQSRPVKEPTATQAKPPPVTGSGFGDLFKKKAGQWECSVCLIQNKETDVKCAACETPKPGAVVTQPDPPKFSFGIPADAGGFKFGIDKADVKSDSDKSEMPKPSSVLHANGPHQEPSTKSLGSVTTSVGVFMFGIPPACTQPNDGESSMKHDSSKPVETEKPQNSGFSELLKADGSKSVTAPTPEKTTETKDVQSKNVEDAVDATSSNSSKPNLPAASNNTFIIKPFAPEMQSKATPMSMFTFGSQDKPAKLPASTESTSTTTNAVFGSGFKMPENVPPSSGSFTFGQSNPIKTQLPMNHAGSDASKPSPFLSFNFSGKNDQVLSTPSAPILGSSKPTEISESTTISTTLTTSTTTTTTTNSVFGSPIFKDAKIKLPFGSSNVTEFGGKSANPSEVPNLNVASTSTTAFPTSTPIFSASSNVFNGPAVPAATNSFGSVPSSAAPFTTGTAQGFNNNNSSEQGFRPTGEPFAAFGSSNNQMSGFSLFGGPSNTFGSTPASGFSATPAPAPSFGSSFGQSAATAEKPVTPFVFGEKNNATAATSAPAASTTAPNVFTFGAPKQETNPPQFSGGFGQSSGTFMFGNPNPPQGNLFGNFNQPETASPFGSTNSTFGNPTQNPFGHSSAPATFGGAPPKFEFGSSSQQTQSNPQPFQFGASNPQTQPNSAQGTTFNIAVPQTFNFTGGQAPVFSATPVGPPRRLLKAARRTQR